MGATLDSVKSLTKEATKPPLKTKLDDNNPLAGEPVSLKINTTEKKSAFAQNLEKTSKSIKPLIFKMRKVEQDRVREHLNLKSIPRTGLVDYDFGYRDRYPANWINPSIYGREDTIEAQTNSWLPLRSEIEYQKRRRKRVLGDPTTRIEQSRKTGPLQNASTIVDA